MSLRSYSEVLDSEGHIVFLHPQGPELKALLFTLKFVPPFNKLPSANVVETYDPSLTSDSTCALDTFETEFVLSDVNKNNDTRKYAIFDSDKIDQTLMLRQSPLENRCLIVQDSSIYSALSKADKELFNTDAPYLENGKFWWVCEDAQGVPTCLRDGVLACVVVHKNIIEDEAAWKRLCLVKRTKLFLPATFKFNTQNEMRQKLLAAFQNQFQVNGEKVECPSDVIILNLRNRRACSWGFNKRFHWGIKKKGNWSICMCKVTFLVSNSRCH